MSGDFADYELEVYNSQRHYQKNILNLQGRLFNVHASLQHPYGAHNPKRDSSLFRWILGLRLLGLVSFKNVSVLVRIRKNNACFSATSWIKQHKKSLIIQMNSGKMSSPAGILERLLLYACAKKSRRLAYFFSHEFELTTQQEPEKLDWKEWENNPTTRFLKEKK